MGNLGTWRGLAKFIVSDATGSRRYTVATESFTNYDAISGNRPTWTGAPGSGSITLTFKWDMTGAPAFGTPTSITVQARLPNGAQLGSSWSVTASDSGSDTRTFYFDDTPVDGVNNNARSGMVELYIFVQRSTPTAWSADSRGAITGIVGGFGDWAQGYLRAPIRFSAHTLSKAGLGGAPTSLLVARDAMHTRLDLSEPVHNESAISLSLQHKQGATVVRSQSDIASAGRYEWSWTAATSGLGGTGRVNKDFLVSASPVDIVLAFPSTTFGGDELWSWDAATLPAGWTKTNEYTITSTSAHTVDPRITFTQLLQHNDSTFGTPPSSKNVASGRRLTSELSFLAARATDANGDGLPDSALAWTEKLWDTGQLVGTEASPVKSRASVTATKGGQTGWSDAFLTWDNVLPGGSWTQKEVITTTDLVGLEAGNTRTLSLNAFDSEVVRLMLEGDLTTPLEHWFPGKPLNIGVGAMKKGAKLTPDSARIWLTRPKIGAGGDVTTEYLTSDKTTWATGDPGDAHAHVLAVSADDPKVFRTAFTAVQTAAWGSYFDVSIAGEVVIGGTPYPITGTLSVTGSKWRHGANEPEASIDFDAEAGHAHWGQDGPGSNELSGRFVPRTPP